MIEEWLTACRSWLSGTCRRSPVAFMWYSAETEQMLLDATVESDPLVNHRQTLKWTTEKHMQNMSSVVQAYQKPGGVPNSLCRRDDSDLNRTRPPVFLSASYGPVHTC